MDTKNKLWMLFMPAALLAGICLGTVAAVKTDTSSLFTAAAESMQSPTLMVDSFFRALKQNAAIAVLLCIFGTTVLGAIPSAFLLGLRGFAIGKTVGALILSYGVRGFFASVCGVFPHNLFYVPFLCLLAICGTRFSLRLLHREGKPHGQLSGYLLSAAFLTLPIILGCLVEGYVSAPLLKAILESHL